jgi:RecJ-like exonuclease
MVESMVSKSFSIKISLQIKNEIKHFQATFTAHVIEFDRIDYTKNNSKFTNCQPEPTKTHHILRNASQSHKWQSS